MKCHGVRLGGGKLNVRAGADECDGLLADGGLARINEPNLGSQGVVELNALASAFDGKGEVVGQGEREVGV